MTLGETLKRPSPKEETAIASQISFFVVDAGCARLLECKTTRQGRIHVEERATLENNAEDHERGRPSRLTGGGGTSYASEGHESEDRRHRFAKQVVDWMEQAAHDLPSEKIVVFSAPRFLGELRKLYGSSLGKRLVEKQGDLTRLTPASLSRHPAVEELLSGPIG